MKRLWYIVLVGFIDALFWQAQSPNLYAIEKFDVNDCKIMLIFARIYEGSPQLKREKAAWIIVNPKGEFEPVHWLNTPQTGKVFWNRPLPSNIVALTHTHPDFVDPRPSKQDEAEARKLNVCIFTLARKGIWSVTPDSIIRQHADAGWFKNVKQRCGNGI